MNNEFSREATGKMLKVRTWAKTKGGNLEEWAGEKSVVGMKECVDF